MKYLRNSIIALLLLICAGFAARPVFRDSKVGVVGCVFNGASEEIKKDDVEGYVVQKLITQLSNLKVPITVLDRTKLAEIIEEHTLYLSGLVDTYKDEKELDIGSTDYLIMARISGFSASTETIEDSDDMSGPMEVIRSTVSYNLSFEMLNSQSGAVAWSFTKDFCNASYTDKKEEVNLNKLLFSSLQKSLNVAFEKMNKKIKR